MNQNEFPKDLYFVTEKRRFLMDLVTCATLEACPKSLLADLEKGAIWVREAYAVCLSARPLELGRSWVSVSPVYCSDDCPLRNITIMHVCRHSYMEVFNTLCQWFHVFEDAKQSEYIPTREVNSAAALGTVFQHEDGRLYLRGWGGLFQLGVGGHNAVWPGEETRSLKETHPEQAELARKMVARVGRYTFNAEQP